MAKDNKFEMPEEEMESSELDIFEDMPEEGGEEEGSSELSSFEDQDLLDELKSRGYDIEEEAEESEEDLGMEEELPEDEEELDLEL